LTLTTRNFVLTLLACALIGPASSWALGLGDITLQSFLGQPLKASIELLASAGEEFDEGCFEVKPENDAGLPNIEGIKIILQKRNEGARLLLSSRHPVNEPAVAINLSTDCPQRLSRQYMVLIDPPVIVDTPTLPIATAPSSAQTSSATAATVALEATRAQKARSDKVGKPLASSGRRHRRVRLSKSVPRLILSGHPTAIAGTAKSDLRIDHGLREPDTYKAEPPSSINLSDENAALKHKLAYLEQQLKSLQLRNAELDKAALNAQVIKPALTDNHSWRSWLLAPTLPVAIGALLAWGWRRNRHTAMADTEANHWPELADRNEPAPAWQIPSQPTSPEEPLMPVFTAPGEPVESHSQSITAAPPHLLKRIEEDGVEVDDSVMDEAEVFMAHGHAELAINLLQEHVRAAPDESPIPWMLLLDLLKRSRQADDYAETGRACKEYFNIRIPDMNEVEPGPDAAGLEAYPHILAELARLWKSPECQTYLDDLIFDRRGGARIGFDPPTFREIMLLRTIQVSESPRIAA
jgi:hypothetical protein